MPLIFPEFHFSFWHNLIGGNNRFKLIEITGLNQFHLNVLKAELKKNNNKNKTSVETLNDVF